MARCKVSLDSNGNDVARTFQCPGCIDFMRRQDNLSEEQILFYGSHTIPIVGPHAWGFNGSLDRPTFTPSIREHEYKHSDGSVFHPHCHSIVTDGCIVYQGDCGHALVGQTVDLPELQD